MLSLAIQSAGESGRHLYSSHRSAAEPDVIRLLVLSFIACLSDWRRLRRRFLKSGAKDGYGEGRGTQAADDENSRDSDADPDEWRSHGVCRERACSSRRDSELLKLSTIQPEVFVADEAFRRIYETTPNDIRTGRKQAIKDLAANIAAGANKRLGRDVIKDIMIDSWTYLSKRT